MDGRGHWLEKRRVRGYVNPNRSLLDIILQFSLFRYGFDPFSDYTTVSGVIRYALGSQQFNHSFKGLVYGTSTAYGLPFCYRRAGLLILGMIMVFRALPVKLNIWHQMQSPLGQAPHFLHIHNGLTIVSVLVSILFQVT